MKLKQIYYILTVLCCTLGKSQHNIILEALEAPNEPPQFTIASCNNPKGYFGKGLPANSADIAVTQQIVVNVTIPGPYNFTTNAVNGVVFTASGIFMEPGIQTINLSASGIPTDYTVDNSSFLYMVNNITETNAGTCNFERKVYVPDQNYTGIIRNDSRHRFLYKVITGPGNKHWLQTNLGAHYNQVGHSNFDPELAATGIDDYLAFGSLFQIGRNSDGHELLTWTSSTSATGLSPSYTPAPANNVTANTGLFYTSTNSTLQQGNFYGNAIVMNGRIIIGPGMPCPTGFMVANESDYSGGYDGGAVSWYNNRLKLVAPKIYRNATNGSIIAYNRRLIRTALPSIYPITPSAAQQFVIEGGSLVIAGSTAHYDRRSAETFNDDNNPNTYDADVRGSLDAYPVRCMKP